MRSTPAASGGIHDDRNAFGHEAGNLSSEAAPWETICAARTTIDTRIRSGTITGVNRAVTLLLSALLLSAGAQEPVTSRTDVIGTTLNQWVADRTLGGFQALNYENRDAGHSLLPADTYRGLAFLQPTEEDKKASRDKGPAFGVRPQPVIGNCSMAGGAEGIGSLARAYLVEEHGHAFLFSQYLHNNLIVYPEHQDHDPGANGMGGGWGDLFPANSPTVLVSQGSSYHDMPFVKAFLSTAAAFRPAVQEGLIRQHILIPTLQAIFRQSNKQVTSEDDYFTGKAHPPVFDESQIDELKMITLAHTMTAQTVPPLAFLEVLAERQSTPGVDFFEGERFTSEKLGNSPVNIARIFRSSAEDYTLTLSASRSIDTQKRPLKYRWEVLQGRKDLIQIETSDEGQKATLHVRWHPPLTSAAGIRTHRVDIGLFVGNGITVSAPAIVSFYMLPNERRFFDKQGKLSEICYEAGNPELGLPPAATDLHWLPLFEAAGAIDDNVAFQCLSDTLSQEQRAAFGKAWLDLSPRKTALDHLGSDPQHKEQADKLRLDLGKAVASALTIHAPDKQRRSLTLREAAEAAVNALVNRQDLFTANQRTLLPMAGKASKPTGQTDLQTECQRLTDWGVLTQKDGVFTTAHSSTPLTEADQYYLQQLHLTVVSQVLLPGFLDRSPAPLFVDSRLASRKSWRDVYHYDDKGKRTGWDRLTQGKVFHFDADGKMLDQGHHASAVTYREDAGHLEFEVQRSKN